MSTETLIPNPKTPSTSVEVQLIQATKLPSQSSDERDILIEKIIADNQSRVDLTPRDNILLRVFSQSQLPNYEWDEILTELGRTPRIFSEVFRLVIQRAAETNQFMPLLQFAVTGKKQDRSLIHAIARSEQLDAVVLFIIKNLSNVTWNLWATFANNLKWLVSRLSDSKSDELIHRVFELLHTLATGELSQSINKKATNRLAKQCVCVIFEACPENAIISSLRGCSIRRDQLVLILTSCRYLGLDLSIQTQFIKYLAIAERFDVLGNKKVWNEIDISMIASLCSNAKIRDLLVNNSDYYEKQFRKAIGAGGRGIGLIIQLCDQYADFSELFDHRFLKSIKYEEARSSSIIRALAAELLGSEVNKHEQEVKCLKNEQLSVTNRLSQKVADLETEVISLKNEISDLNQKVRKKTESQILGLDTIKLNAQKKVLVAVVEIVDSIRTLSQEMKVVDRESIENLHLESIHIIHKLGVEIVSPDCESTITTNELFEQFKPCDAEIAFGGRPAYIFVSGSLRSTLRKGVIIF